MSVNLSLTRSLLVMTVASMTMVACNSGGGGSNDGFTQPSIPNTVVGFGSVDPQETALTADMGAEMGADLTTPMIFGVQASDTPEKAVKVKEVIDKTLRQTLSAISLGSTQYATGAITQITEPCANSGEWGDTGNIVYTVDLANLNSLNTGQFSAGDKATMDISGCRDSGNSSVKITGSVTYTFNTDINEIWLNEPVDHSSCTTPASCVVGMTTQFNNFGGGDSTFGIVIHGDITFETVFDTASTESNTMSMNSLWMVLDISGTQYGINLRNLNMTGTVDTAGNYTLDGSFELGATMIGGYINVTVNNISGNNLDDFASSGNTVISGANNHSITTTYGVNTITLDVDNDGNPGTDFSLTGTWADFDSGSLS